MVVGLHTLGGCLTIFKIAAKKTKESNTFCRTSRNFVRVNDINFSIGLTVKPQIGFEKCVALRLDRFILSG